MTTELQGNLNSLSDRNLRDLAATLDEVSPNGNEYWRLLIDQLPVGMYKGYEVERIAAESLRDRSPALRILQDIQRRNTLNSLLQLDSILNRINCQRARNLFKKKTPLLVTQQPQSGLYKEGSVVQLHCGAECQPSGPLYQWFMVSLEPMDQSKPCIGKTAPTLRFERIEITDSGKYCCRVTHPYLNEGENGKVLFSDWATITVAGRPVIKVEPQPLVSVRICDFLELSCVAECFPGEPIYQWFKAGEPCAGWTESKLSFKIHGFQDEGVYYCMVGNPLIKDTSEGWRSSQKCLVKVLPPSFNPENLEGSMEGNHIPRSNSRATTVIERPDHLPVHQETPRITSSPVPVVRSPHASMTNSVSANRFAPNTLPNDHLESLDGNHEAISLKAESELGLPIPVQERNITFEEQPSNIDVLIKTPFTIKCKAVSSPGQHIRYQLYRHEGEGVKIENANSISGEIAVREGLQISSLSSNMYFVRAHRVDCEEDLHVDSNMFKITPKKAMFVAQPLPQVEGVTREKLVLMCRFDTEGKKSNFSYQWTRSGQPKSANPEIIKGAKSNILTLENLDANDRGHYCCRVDAKEPLPDFYYSQEVLVTVGHKQGKGRLTITEHPQPVTANVFDTVKLYACAMTSYGQEVSFEWFKENKSLGKKGPVLEITYASLQDAGIYSCKVSFDDVFQMTNTAKVHINKKVAIEYKKAEVYKEGKLQAKVALLIANQHYKKKEYAALGTPEQDVKQLCKRLRQFGFNVLSLSDLSLSQMQKAENLFNRMLPSDATGVLALVYFAGHGFTNKADSVEYLIPVDASGLDPTDNINRETFCSSPASKPKFAKLIRITDCCRTGQDVPQSHASNFQTLQKSDYYNFYDIAGCGFLQSAVEHKGGSFLAEILLQLLEKDDLTVSDLIEGIQNKASEDSSTIQRPQVKGNIKHKMDMRFNDEIDEKAYEDYIDEESNSSASHSNPKILWDGIDPNKLPKDHKLKVTGRGLSQKVDVLLTIEEQFCNVLKIIVKVVKKGLNCSPTVVIPTDKLIEQGVQLFDEEIIDKHSVYSVVVRGLEELKEPLKIYIEVKDEQSEKEELLYQCEGYFLFSSSF